MSTVPDQPPSEPPARPVYLLANGVLMFFGFCFLLPGACSIYFIVVLAMEKQGNPLNDPYVRAFSFIWVICFVIAGIGVAMMIVARKRIRAEQ